MNFQTRPRAIVEKFYFAPLPWVLKKGLISMSINLKANPFFLDDEACTWVSETLASMTINEKIGQLFCPLGATDDESYLKMLTQEIGVGGIMYRPAHAENVLKTHGTLQNNSKIPMLLAANLEAGGNGAALEGSNFAKPMGVAATDDDEMGYWLGRVACREGAALGLNWAFAPIVDIDTNFRNPITNLRTFGSDHMRVIRMAKGYLRAADEAGLAVSIKHFPGDGVDERDQHLLTSVNSLSCEEWDATYGEVYQTLINDGAKTVMVGHIAQPAYQKALAENPSMYDKKTVPATLSKEIMVGLLREKLGFNGLIVTDATTMLGYLVAGERSKLVPLSIARGADMFLFNKNLEEDYQAMFTGYEEGILTEERVDEAVTRILATKASLGLHTKQKEGTLVPPAEALNILHCKEHTDKAVECADKAVTLVKDTQSLLPLSPTKTKRVYLNVLETNQDLDTPLKKAWMEKLEAEGFEVHLRNRDTNVDIMSAFMGTGDDPQAMALMQEIFEKVEDFKNRYDLAIYVSNYETASNNVVIRLQWQGLMGMGNDAPWFVGEIPTMFISHANPYHLLDVPMIKTLVNAYTYTPEVVDAVVEKIMGRSEFKGVSPVDVSCGREDTLY
ncbi:glycoside hydrolase family 3 protein [Anaerosporobacter sp.]|uniref:glycoside hydrolase family 3 protein n=1 Tax=Anaerosporobacter sp. TaxID=1872529 RepID=UPI00286F5517|nr:glycoside hydrolase family 3 N-terminal domain-containing protein [Anaerosporobacter sp.]